MTFNLDAGGWNSDSQKGRAAAYIFESNIVTYFLYENFVKTVFNKMINGRIDCLDTLIEFFNCNGKSIEDKKRNNDDEEYFLYNKIRCF